MSGARKLRVRVCLRVGDDGEQEEGRREIEVKVRGGMGGQVEMW